MSSAAFYHKLNKRFDETTPIGSIVTMSQGVTSPYYKPSGDIVNTADYPLLNSFLVGTDTYYRGIETTEFSITGQVPLNYVASSPYVILAVGQNSKIYLSTDGATWASYGCPAPAGVFTDIFVEYLPTINKFCINDKVGSTESIYLSTDGVTWTGVNFTAPSTVTAYSAAAISNNVWWGSTFSGGNITAYRYSTRTKYVPSVGKWCNLYYGGVNLFEAYGKYANITRSWYAGKTDILDLTETWTVSSAVDICGGESYAYWNDVLTYFPVGRATIDLYTCSSFYTRTYRTASSCYVMLPGNYNPPQYRYIYNEIGSSATSLLAPFSASILSSECDIIGTNPGTMIHCTNSLYQSKIFANNGYFISGSVYLQQYTNGFVFPTTIKMAYDVKNSRYMAFDPATNYFYTSSDGATWTTPVSIGGTTSVFNNLVIRHNQDRIIACGRATKTTDDYGGNWSAQTFLSLGGNFSSICNLGAKTIACALSSSVVAYADNGANFDLVSITDSGDWQNIYSDGTTFFLTSRLRALKTSTNGTTWTTRTAHTAFTNTAHYITSMCNYGAHYCAISKDSVDTLTSTDGITWTKNASVVPVALNSITIAALADSVVRVVAVGTNICYTHDNYGTTSFTIRTIGTGNWSNLVYADNKFVCISLSSSYMAYSYDGVTWTTVTTPFIPKSLTYANGFWVIKGTSYLCTTSDLTNFNLSQPCEATTSGAITVYDATNNKIITANSTSISYASMDVGKVRLPYVAPTTSGTQNYVKVA